MSTHEDTIHNDPEPSLAEAFTREHHQIDSGIEEYLADAASAQDPERRARPLLVATEALRRHIYLEEEVVFPHLPQGQLMMPLMVMRREHGELWRRMDELSAILEEGSAGSRDIDAACTELLSLLDAHNSKEEPIIYPHMDTDLGPAEQSLVRELLVEGALPEGWVCQAVR